MNALLMFQQRQRRPTYSPPALWPGQPRSQYCGINLNALAYFGSNFPFANIMKSGDGWASTTNDALPEQDASGCPTSLLPGQGAASKCAWPYSGYPLNQTFVMLWDGDGSISFRFNEVNILTSAPGRITFNMVSGDRSIVPLIQTTNPANPIRNVRVLWPGTESTYLTNPFNPLYLNLIAPFGVLRFMDWGSTNSTPVVEWSQRAKVGDSCYTGPAGVPIELMIDLANRMKAPPWICIPHMASDDYVRQLAMLLKAKLDPTLRPRIEYSNEMWNFGFQQTGWGNARSAALGLGTPWGTPSLFYAKRAVECFSIMRGVYGADAGKLVRVFSGQCAWTQFLDNATSYSTAPGNFDAIAVLISTHAQLSF